ncbi:MAG: glycosyltransferase [Microbacteriaceae bacterium]|nr:glycosyltransferase [Microbacteriaceae bacterium]
MGPGLGSITVEPKERDVHTLSVVVPVYRGEATLRAVVEELVAYERERLTADGHAFRVAEILLVHDGGPDGSPRVMRELAAEHPEVRPVWLSRNFGQHAATLAGMASTGGDWIVTLDEDGQHDPADIAGMLDTAMREQKPLVYAKPLNTPSHGAFRNATSRGAKKFITAFLGNPHASEFQSFRLILGSVGRGVAAYAGSGVYLDIALSWVVPAPATSPVTLRDEGERRSGYTTRSLLAHFWRMVLTSGTRGLRFVTALGVGFAVIGLLWTIWIVIARLTGIDTGAPGWASTIVVILISVGAILFSLGTIAEYLGIAVNMSLGKPPYLIVPDPADGPLGRAPRTPSS